MLSSIAMDPRRVMMSRWGNLIVCFGSFFLFALALCHFVGTPAYSDLFAPSSDDLAEIPQYGKSSVIIPAYHEVDSLKPLIKRLTTHLPEDSEIVVVDDNSQDGTEELVKSYGSTDGLDVHLITRTNKSGLSSAVIDGMAAAKGDILLVMDADGQHPPEAAAALLRSLRAMPKALMAMGAREKLANEWPWYRRVMSWGATQLASPLVGANVHDPMTGFFAIRTDVFKKTKAVNTSGFKIALELLLKSVLVQNNWTSDLGERVIEVPYTFETRKSGASKLGCKVIFQYAMQLFGLYYWRLGMMLPIVMASVATAGVYILLAIWQNIRGRMRYERLRRMSGDLSDEEEAKAMLLSEKYED